MFHSFYRSNETQSHSRGPSLEGAAMRLRRETETTNTAWLRLWLWAFYTRSGPAWGHIPARVDAK